MGNFNSRDSRSGGRDFNSRSSFGGRGSERPIMHKATCSGCGKECEVPFRPTGSKPVYCRECFRNNGGPSDARGDDRGFGRPRNEDRPMFDAVCANCSKNCKVPFQPGEGKQVFCSDCFEKKGGDPRRANNISRNSENSYKEQFEELNAKLDKILQLLSPSAPVVEKTSKPKKSKETIMLDKTSVPIESSPIQTTVDKKDDKKKVIKKPQTKKE